MSDKVSLEMTREEVVLNQIHGLLEKQLVEPFKDNYKELLEEARTALKKRAGYQDDE